MRKPDPAPQLCEARIGLQGFQPLIRVEVFGEQVRAFREGAFERGEGFVLLPRPTWMTATLQGATPPESIVENRIASRLERRQARAERSRAVEVRAGGIRRAAVIETWRGCALPLQ